jgi:hypothetical protein
MMLIQLIFLLYIIAWVLNFLPVSNIVVENKLWRVYDVWDWAWLVILYISTAPLLSVVLYNDHLLSFQKKYSIPLPVDEDNA